MNDKISVLPFDHLDSTQFESFCFDLLHLLGFKNIDWRKGTGHNASPADQGRDIECEFHPGTPDGTFEQQKWFVECKHHRHGVPPTELDSLLSWASAERPDKALIICSSFLTNPCKEFLRKYEQNNKPPFKIVVWENPNLSMLSATFAQFLNRYGLAEKHAYLQLLHPAHIRYLKMVGPNTLAHLFSLLDELESKERDQILGMTYHNVISPRYKDAPPGYEGTIGGLMIDPVHYHAFKDKCFKLRPTVAEHFLVSAIVNDVLQCVFHRADTTSVDVLLRRYDNMITQCEERIRIGSPDADVLRKIIRDMEKSKRTAGRNARQAYKLYQLFCERVVKRLPDEDRSDLLRKLANKGIESDK